jgi:hypothetical protein
MFFGRRGLDAVRDRGERIAVHRAFRTHEARRQLGDVCRVEHDEAVVVEVHGRGEALHVEQSEAQEDVGVVALVGHVLPREAHRRGALAAPDLRTVRLDHHSVEALLRREPQKQVAEQRDAVATAPDERDDDRFARHGLRRGVMGEGRLQLDGVRHDGGAPCGPGAVGRDGRAIGTGA